jgi:predicted nucleotidyltransferase
MKFNLKKHTVLLTVAGSRAYNMSLENSDVDLKGVAVSPKEMRNGFLHKFEQADGKEQMKVFNNLLSDVERDKSEEGELEGCVYEIRKFFRLAANSNPNILDALFCRDEEVRYANDIGKALREAADDFVSAKCRWTFGGYAISQLKRIKLHRGYLLSPPSHKPTREEFGLPEHTLIPANQLAAANAAIRKQIDSWAVDYGSLGEADKIYIEDQLAKSLSEMKLGASEEFAAAARNVGYDENFILLLDRERRYRASMASFNQYASWKKNRNPERASMEAESGFDRKHGSHLVRLLKMCHEILVDGKINVYREDADELLAIRRGEWSYEKLMEFVDQQEVKIDEAYQKTTLPKAPDSKRLNDLCVDLVNLFDRS